jgi:uncharacterized protein YdaU (DUF1376 family)
MVGVGEVGKGKVTSLNYYPHHIGDYLRDTVHLTALEDGTYRRMLDLYYASEKPLPLDFDWLCKLVRARENPEREAVHEILKQFFEKCAEGWRNKRADFEIKLAAKKAKVARLNGKLGGRPKTQRVSSGLAKQKLADNPDESSQNQNQNHIQNQKKEQSAQRSRGSRLPSAWEPSEILKAWAVKERPDLNVDSTVASFRDYWTAAAGSKGVKLDWEATFRNWVRAERPGGRKAEPDYSAVQRQIEEEEKLRAKH